MWALHLSDGVLGTPWIVGGFLVAGLLALVGAFRLREEEIPCIALLTAAFFVVSLIHVRVGPASVHLLMNGLLGVILGRRVALAIPIGLALQAVLIGHGGFTTLGVNACALTIPALLAGAVFRQLAALDRLRSRSGRMMLVGLGTAIWALAGVFTVGLLATNPWRTSSPMRVDAATALTLHPITLTATFLAAMLCARGAERWRNAPEHALGLLLGVVAVLLSAFLNCLALMWGGVASWSSLALLVLAAHLPLAVLEGVVLGFAVAFLARAKPELLGIAAERLTRPKETEETEIATVPYPGSLRTSGGAASDTAVYAEREPSPRPAGEVQGAFGTSSSD